MNGCRDDLSMAGHDFHVVDAVVAGREFQVGNAGNEVHALNAGLEPSEE